MRVKMLKYYFQQLIMCDFSVKYNLAFPPSANIIKAWENFLKNQVSEY